MTQQVPNRVLGVDLNPSGAFPHPETGELLETKDEFIDAMNAIELRMSLMWIVRRKIREEFATRFDPYLPTRRKRSDKQELVVSCPRCGVAIE